MDNRSTISEPAANFKKDVFQDFKLEDFKMNSFNQPHRLREARRSFVLYLEPTNPIQSSLKRFQDKTLLSFGPNQAHNTHLHISMLNRILIERGKDFFNKWNSVDDLIRVINEEMSANLKAPEFIKFDILEKPTKSLVVHVRLCPQYEQLLNRIESKINNKCTVFEVSPMNKIHLAYNLIQSIPKATLKQMRETAEETIDIYDWAKSDWRIVLYEVMLESQVVGIQHQLKEIKAWPIQSQKSSQESSSAWPISFKLKLKFLSFWYNNTNFYSNKSRQTQNMICRN